MKSLLIGIFAIASLTASAETKIEITKAVIEGASTAGQSLKQFSTMNECVSFAKKSEASLKEMGARILENVCSEEIYVPGSSEVTYLNVIKFF